MYTKVIYYLLLPLLLVSACQKPALPVEETGDIVFFAKGQLASAPITLNAGEENYYMHTGYELNADNIYELSGWLGKSDCQDCPGQLKITIRGHKQVAQGEDPEVAMSLQPGQYNYEGPNSGFRWYATTFQVETVSAGPHSFKWAFGDGQTHTTPFNSYTHRYTDINPKLYPVCLETTDTKNCISQICYEANVPLAQCSPNFDVQHSHSGLDLDFQLLGMSPNVQAQWDFGDGNTSNQLMPQHSYLSRGVFQVCLSLTDTQNCVSEICKNVAVGNVSGCGQNFTYTTTKVGDELRRSQVIVEWIDEQGQVFSSNVAEQDAGARFEILAADPYDVNRQGEATRKLKLLIDCELFNGNAASKKLQLTEAVLAVAHP